MKKKIKKFWNTPITWGASIKASLLATAISMGLIASLIGWIELRGWMKSRRQYVTAKKVSDIPEEESESEEFGFY